MFYHLCHQTLYTYPQAVKLSPHLLRLCPRSNGWQKLLDFQLFIEPKPTRITPIYDLDGNHLHQIWFDDEIETLNIKTDFKIETLIENPFIFQLESWALKLPFDYTTSWCQQLQPYLNSYYPHFDPVAIELAQEICHEVQQNPLNFLFSLNQKIYQNCQYLTREEGDPLPPRVTWQKKQGSCRDFSILFIEVCRAMGLGARFVSGYQEGDPDQVELDLHGWVEVYLPGAGWRGYDPTYGLAVSDRHIALVASAIPQYTVPISGTVTTAGTKSNMVSKITVLRS